MYIMYFFAKQKQLLDTVGIRRINLLYFYIFWIKIDTK